MAKRKRIPYDPPGSRKKRRRYSIPRADQLFLTRRVLVFKTAIVGGFAALAVKLGYMQVIQHQEYQTQAKNNTQEPRTIKAPRGLIYDRKGRELAINQRSWRVQVVPSDLPSDPAQRQRVLDTLTTLLGLRDALVLDPNNVPEGQEDTVYARLAQMLNYDQKWIDQIKAQVKINFLVLVQDELTDDEAARFRAASSELPGVLVMNILDYQINNTSAPKQPIPIKTNVPRDTALKLEANKLYLPGVELDDDLLLRQYVGGDVMSHLLGYVGTINETEYKAKENQNAAGQPIYELDDAIGKNGLELSMEKVLRGEKGNEVVEIDASGYVVRELPEGHVNAVPGKNIKLTVDLELQAAISDFLQRGIKFSNDDRRAKGTLSNDPDGGSGRGAVVMLDVQTGEVLAMVSWPQYDNQLFVEGISQRKFDEYRNDKNEPLTNHASGGHYPPGSTLKPFMAASALHEKTLTTSTQFFCSGGLKVPYDNDESKGQAFWCWEREYGQGHGGLDVVGGLMHSCDVFFYNVGAPKQKSANDYLHYYDLDPNSGDIIADAKHYFEGLGIDRIHRDLTDLFWMGQPTKIDLPWEAPGLVPDEKWLWETWQQPWSAGATINVSIGQGYFLATPLQMALNTATIANNGTIYRPLLINEIDDDHKKTSQKSEPEVLRKLGIEQQFLQVVQTGMRKVVSEPEGTANNSVINDQPVSKWLLTNPQGEPEIPIAGKTGTAEFGKQNPDGTYNQSHSWFTCYAPYDKPEVAVTVFLYDGGEGSTYAVPVADQSLRAYFELTGKRKRGVVLRTDGQPISKDKPSPLPQNTIPAPGTIKSQGDH